MLVMLVLDALTRLAMQAQGIILRLVVCTRPVPYFIQQGVCATQMKIIGCRPGFAPFLNFTFPAQLKNALGTS